MNKRDLIKALFKDPTIKALYESGHFDATDINRAILSEAADMEEALKRGTPEFNVRQRISTDYKQGENSQNFTKFLDKYLEKHKNGVIQHSRFQELNNDLKTFLLDYLGKKIKLAQDEMKIIKASETAQQTNNDADKKQVKDAKQKTDQKNAELEKKVNQALETGSEGGDGEQAGSEGGEIPEGLKDYLTVYEKIIGNGLDGVKLLENKPHRKAFVVYFLQQKMENNEAVDVNEKVKYYATAVEFFKKFVDKESQAEEIAKALESQAKGPMIDFLKDNDSIGKLQGLLNNKTDKQPEETGVSQEAIAKLDEFLGETPDLLDLVNNHPKFKELLAVAYVKALGEQPEEVSSTTNAPETPETSTATPSPQLSPASSPEEQLSGAIEESINRALSGIFLTENTEDTETNTTGTEGGTEDTETDAPTDQPVNVDEVPKMLELLKQLFDREKLAIPVEEIWTASQEKEDGEQGGASEEDMEDVSKPEPAEFQEAWTEQLQTFFGKNPKKSSFMRRLLLKDQASMLYTTISVLEQIEAGEQAGDDKKGQAAAYTDMNRDDEKERQAEKPPGLEEQRSALELDTSPEGIARSKGQSPAPAPEQQAQQAEKVQLPPKKKRIIKQDLQAMVDLLRDVKKAIGSYKDYSTRNSVDPRFDGSKLKAKLDNLLAQAQEDIFDLHSNLELPAQQPSEEEGNIEEALSGIFMEKADPQRKEKIALVKDVYMEAKRLYIKSLAVSMAPGTGQSWTKAQEEAGNILEILKREDFIALFPTGMSTASGKIMTVTNAYDVMKDLIQKFIEIVRDIVLIAKTDYVSPTNIRRSKMQLKSISEQIADLFKIPSKFSPEELRQAKQEEAEDENNQALTPIAVENLENQENDSGANVTQDAPVGEPTEEIKQGIDQTQNIPEPQRDELKDDVDESARWFQTLGGDQKGAILAFGQQLIEVRKVNEVEIPQGFADQIQTDEEKITIAFNALSEEYQPIVQEVMTKDTDNLVDWLKTLLGLKNKVGDSLAKKFLDFLKKGAGKVADAAKAAMKPIKELYKQIRPQIQKRLQSLAQELTVIKEVTKYLTEASMKHFWEMLTTFFKKNVKKIKSQGESLFKKALETAGNLKDDQKELFEKNKAKMIDLYDKVSVRTKKFMDELPGKLDTKFVAFVIQLNKLLEYIMNLPSAAFDLAKSSKAGQAALAAMRPIALAMFLKFASPDKFKGLEEQTPQELQITPEQMTTTAQDTSGSGEEEDEIPEPEQLGKDNSELEDVDGFDDNEERDDSASPEDEDDIQSFSKEVKSVGEFLPNLQDPSNSAARQFQPIKTSFVNTLSQQKVPTKRAKEMFNKFFLLIFKQMNKDLVMEKAASTSFNVPKIKQDVKEFISSLKSDDLEMRDFKLFFNNIGTKGLVKILSLIKQNKQQIAKAIYGESGKASQDGVEKATRGKEVNLEEALKPIIESMLKEQYNY